MHWFLVLWFTTLPAAGMQIQSVSSQSACVSLGAQIKKASPFDVTFACFNDAPKKEESNGQSKSRKSH